MRHHKVFEFSREAVQVGVAWITAKYIEHAQELALGNGHRILDCASTVFCWVQWRSLCRKKLAQLEY